LTSTDDIFGKRNARNSLDELMDIGVHRSTILTAFTPYLKNR
jgi:hypothetical protein